MKSYRRFFHVIVCLPLVFLIGCSLPRIIIVGDSLTAEEHLSLGVSYEKNGEFENAVAEYEKAAKSLPDAAYYLGNVYVQQNDLDKAERYYREALEKGVETGDLYNNLAWTLYLEGDRLEEALTLVRRAMSLNPENKTAYEDTEKLILEVMASSK